MKQHILQHNRVDHIILKSFNPLYQFFFLSCRKPTGAEHCDWPNQQCVCRGGWPMARFLYTHQLLLCGYQSSSRDASAVVRGIPITT